MWNFGRPAGRRALRLLESARRTRPPVAGRQRDDSISTVEKERACTDVKRPNPARDQRGESRLKFAVAANIKNNKLLPNSFRGGDYVSSLRLCFGNIRVHECANCRRLGHELAQQV